MRKMRAMMKNFTDALFPFSQICFVTIMKQIKFIMLMNGESGSIEENIWGIVQFGCGMLTEVPTFYWENLVPPSFTSLFLFQFHL